jgi:UDP-glucuronate decarboxylase
MTVALGCMLMLFVYVFFIIPSQALSSHDGAYQPPVTLEQLKEMVRAEVAIHTQDVEQQLVEDHAGTGRSTYPPVKQLPESRRLRILVTGGSGFVGSHLTDRLMRQGHTVIVMDNFFTGRQKNVQQWIGITPHT